MKEKRKQKNMLLPFIVLCAAILALVAIGLRIRGNGKGEEVAVSGEELEKQVYEDIENSYVDAKEYYASSGELQDTIPVEESVAVQSESEVTETLRERGFTDIPITTEYTSDGAMIEAKEVGESGEMHPYYQTYYVSDTGEVWTIQVMSGSVIANPVRYNMESNPHGVQLILSESEVITCYDSVTNSFYETIPKESELIVKVVDHIDAATLNSLTVEGIEAL